MYRYVKAYSRTVGDEFGKEHWNVLVEIRTLDKKIEQSNERTGKLGQLKFEPTYIFQSTYTDRWNREKPEYLLSKDGFTLLVMGFVGAMK
jgi:Rha family phage regulatory protein